MSNQQDPFVIIKSIKGQGRASFIVYNKEKRERRLNIFNWRQKQHQLYIRYLKENRYTMEQNHHRRSKVFKKMQKIIKTRTSIQIKSHHQKMLVKYGSIKDIIQTFEGDQMPTQSESVDSSRESIHQSNFDQILDYRDLGQDVLQSNQMQQLLIFDFDSPKRTYEQQWLYSFNI